MGPRTHQTQPEVPLLNMTTTPPLKSPTHACVEIAVTVVADQ